MNQKHRVTPILLWGMMGAGKSALARHLCESFGTVTLDLDASISLQHGESVAALIDKHGLEWFRVIERKTLLSILDEDTTQVIALGGGALLDPAFRRAIRARAYICTLTAHPSILSQRIALQADVRPLLIDEAHDVPSMLRLLLEERQDAYLDSDCLIDTSNLTVAQTADLITPLFLHSEAA
jgi:shikimate kinase/3-dehydroquinate synthase